MTDKALLQSKMVLHGDTGVTLARALKISQTSFSKKLNGQVEFTQSEIQAIAHRYSLSPEEIYDIFLKNKKEAKE